MKKTLLLSILAAVAALGAGCVQTQVETAKGDKFKRTSFLNRQSVGKVTFNAATGDFAIEGYQNDQVEGLAAVARAAAEGAVKGVNPVK